MPGIQASNLRFRISGFEMQDSSNFKILSKLLPQREDEHGVAGGDRDVLTPVREVADGAICDLAAELSFPEELSVASVERVEVAFTAAAEQDVRRCRQHTGVGHVVHWKSPFSLSRLGVESLYGAGCSRTKAGIRGGRRQSGNGIRPKSDGWK